MKAVTGQIDGKQVTFFVWIQCRTEGAIGPTTLLTTKTLPIELFPSTVAELKSLDSELSENALLSTGR